MGTAFLQRGTKMRWYVKCPDKQRHTRCSNCDVLYRNINKKWF